jgi:hypothetical protein
MRVTTSPRVGWRGIVITILLVLGVTYRGNLCTGALQRSAPTDRGDR